MTLRRRSPLRPSRGTQVPASVRAEVRERDGGCAGQRIGWPGDHRTALQLDHVRASGALGVKSRSTADNAVMLCLECHDWKTSHGREARPQLIEWIERRANQ